ncbi:MAG: hypothetical protein CM15mV128_310 [Caudoviricetes sp.]|nr:MAG: hypothetical protein CM15mV128_310 [Caudoviricetes sp.]
MFSLSLTRIYTCLLDGYMRIYEKTIEIGQEEINKHGIYLKFDCTSSLALSLSQRLFLAAAAPVWQRKAGQSKSIGGLNAKGRAAYNRATGGNLKAPVTTKPSKIQGQ